MYMYAYIYTYTYIYTHEYVLHMFHLEGLEVVEVLARPDEHDR